MPPGHFVLVDQFIDRTFAREKSFFGPGCVAHVSMADPVSPALVDLVEAAARAESIPHTRGGTYLVMEGPQFSTRAESNLYRSWGCAVIGMTNMPEAKLAREAEICYATVAMVTDYDCWHHEHTDVDVAAIIKVLSENVDKAHRLIERLARDFPARASALPDRLGPRARRRHHHAARGARSGAGRQARCGGGAGAGLGVRPNDFCRVRESHMQTIDAQVHAYERNHPGRPWHGNARGSAGGYGRSDGGGDGRCRRRRCDPGLGLRHVPLRCELRARGPQAPSRTVCGRHAG